MDGRSSDGLVVVCAVLEFSRCSHLKVKLTSVIHKDGAEVTNDVDNEENGAILASKSEVASTSISRNGVGLYKLGESIVHSLRRPKHVTRGISCESKCQKDDEKDDCVNIVGQEGGLDSSEHGIDDNTEWEQEASSCSGDASEGVDDS